MIKKAVILCGGLATRFLPITKGVPKELLPILNKPAIHYCVEDLKNNGVTDILIILGNNKESIKAYFSHSPHIEERLRLTNKIDLIKSINEISNGLNISYIYQTEAKGTGHAVYKAKDFVGDDDFILIFPDEILFGKSYAKYLISAHSISKSSIIPLRKIDIIDCTKYGMVEFEKNARGTKIKNIVEKPSIENTPSDICYTGGGLFTSEIFGYLEKCKQHSNGEIYLTDAFEYLIEKDALYGVETDGIRFDIGNPLGLIKANIIAGLNDKDINTPLKEFIKNIAKQL